MPLGGLQPNAISYNSVLDAHARCGDLTSCASLLRAMVGATTGSSSRRSSSSLLAVSTDPTVSANAPFGDVMPNARTYSILMRACVEAQRPNDAAKLLAHLQIVESRQNHQMNGASLGGSAEVNKENKSSSNSGTRSKNNSSNSNGRKKNISSSKGSGSGERSALMANAVHYTTLIDGFGSAGQLDSAFECLRDMEARGLNANVYTWTSLIDACVKAAARAPHASVWRDAELAIAAAKSAEAAAAAAESALMEEEMATMASYPTLEELEADLRSSSSSTRSSTSSSTNSGVSSGASSGSSGRGSFARLQAARLRKEANALKDRANTLTASLQPRSLLDKLRGTPSQVGYSKASSGATTRSNRNSESEDQAVAQIIADLNLAFGSGESRNAVEILEDSSVELSQDAQPPHDLTVAALNDDSAATGTTPVPETAGSGSTRSRETLLRLALSLFQAMLQSGVRPNKVIGPPYLPRDIYLSCTILA